MTEMSQAARDLNAQMADLRGEFERRSLRRSFMSPDTAAAQADRDDQEYAERHRALVNAYVATLPESIRWLFNGR